MDGWDLKVHLTSLQFNFICTTSVTINVISGLQET